MKFIYLVIIYILLFTIVSCGSGVVGKEQLSQMYREKISMHTYQSDLYVEEMQKTARLLAKATEDKYIRALLQHYNQLNFNRRKALMSIHHYERLLNENESRGY